MARYDWAHQMMQQATQQQQDTRLVLFGHVSSYDPKTHAVKVMVPQYDDEDENPFLTGWIPLGSLLVGDKFGIQYAPKGGATSDDPGKGEQCQVMLMQRSTGLAAVANLMFTDEHTPPGKGSDDATTASDPPHGDPADPDGLTQLQPTELVIRMESGSFFKLYANGDIQVYAANDLKVFAQQNAELTVREGDCNVTVEKGDLTVDVLEGDIKTIAEQGEITIEATLGDISINCPEGTLDINAKEVDITADVANVTAAAVTFESTTVDVGTALLQPLVKEQFLLLFDAHVHPNGAGVTGPPTEPSNPTDSTTILKAE